MVDNFDKPLQSIEDDLLNRDGMVRGLCNALVTYGEDRYDVKANNVVVGLAGPWGSGKSSILNFVYEELSKNPKTIVVRFNPWLISDHKTLLSAFLNQLLLVLDPLNAAMPNSVYDLIKAIRKYGKSLGVAGELVSPYLPGPYAALYSAIRLIFALASSRNKTIDDQRNELETHIEKLNIPIVVLIDELDRLDPNDIKEITRLIKSVGDLKGISYLVAYDPVQTAKMLTLNYNTHSNNTDEFGLSYLEKIIQLNVHIRDLLDYEIKHFVSEELEKYTNTYIINKSKNDKLLKENLLETILPLISTMRDIKRLTESFRVISSMTDHQIYYLDIFGYCVILTLYPELVEKIKESSDRISSDFHVPTKDWVLFMSDKTEDRFEYILKQKKDVYEEKWQELLIWLFPYLEKSSDLENGILSRIKYHRNLIRVLYLGNPVHDFSNQEIKEAYKETKDFITKFIENLLTRDELKISAFLNRIQDNFDSLNSSYDHIFWINLAKGLERKSDWISSIETIQRDFIRDIRTTLIQIANQSDVSKTRIKKIFQHLLEEQELNITAEVLHYEMSQFGVGIETADDEPRGGITIHSQEELEACLKIAVPYFEKAIADGRWLKRTITPTALYLLKKYEGIKEDIRSSLTKQLSTHEAIITFACVFVPPGYSADPKILGKLVITDDLRKSLDSLKIDLPDTGFGTWAESSVEKLKTWSAGEDPIKNELK